MQLQSKGGPKRWQPLFQKVCLLSECEQRRSSKDTPSSELDPCERMEVALQQVLVGGETQQNTATRLGVFYLVCLGRSERVIEL